MTEHYTLTVRDSNQALIIADWSS